MTGRMSLLPWLDGMRIHICQTDISSLLSVIDEWQP